MKRVFRWGLVLGSIVCARVTAQDAAPGAVQVSLPVVTRIEACGIDAAALRSALASELAVAVEIASEPPAGQAYLLIEGSRLEQLRVAFVRADASSVERTLDLSSMQNQASEALALLAANLTRDEAAELLAQLQSAAPPPASPPTAADTEKPPILLAKPAAARPKPLPRGCDPRPRLVRRTFGLDVFPHVGTTGREPQRVERSLSINVFGGMTGAVRGLELGSFFNIDLEGTCGLQMSSVLNIDAGSTEGMQLGEINWTGGRLDGAQLGLVSITKGDIQGAQLALVNIGAGELVGLQFGLANFAANGVGGAQFGLANVDAAQLEGMQLGLANTARLQMHGLQLGLANLSAGDTHGLQFGLANLSAGETRGAQLGLVNVSSGPVSGAMFGLVNVAEDADAAIGLVNVMWRGTTHLDVWGTDAGLGMVGIRHGGRYTHNIYGVGATSRHGDFVLATALGLGVTAFSTDPIFVDIDVIGYNLSTPKSSSGSSNEYVFASIIQLRIPVGWQIAKGIALFASPALNLSIAERDGNRLADPSLLGSSLLTNADAKLAVRIWPGFTAGLRFF